MDNPELYEDKIDDAVPFSPLDELHEGLDYASLFSVWESVVEDEKSSDQELEIFDPVGFAREQAERLEKQRREVENLGSRVGEYSPLWTLNYWQGMRSAAEKEARTASSAQKSPPPELEELQEVAGCLPLEGDEFGDMCYDAAARRWSLKKLKRALHVPPRKEIKELDTKGATRYEFQLIARFLYWYEEMEPHEKSNDVPPADDNVKFLRQVWKDKGYGVDCCPDEDFSSPFTPIPSLNDSEKVTEYMQRAVQLAMSAINDHSREKYMKTYTLVEVEDAVWTRTASYYFTFKVKQDGEVEVLEKFRAMVSVLPPPTRLLEYKRLLADGTWELNIVTAYDDL